jgi:hypothetical protein
MHRLVDEYNEDVTFLVLGMVKNQIEPAHIQFRDSLFAEDFLDPEDIVGSQQRRNLVPRRKIRAYIARVGDASGNPHREIEVAEAIGSAYSGFVHGAAPHVLDMYGGDPPRFHLNGMSNTPRRQQHLRDAWNYVYRTLLSFEAVAHAFEARQVVENVRGATEEFRRRSGRAS